MPASTPVVRLTPSVLAVPASACALVRLLRKGAHPECLQPLHTASRTAAFNVSITRGGVPAGAARAFHEADAADLGARSNAVADPVVSQGDAEGSPGHHRRLLDAHHRMARLGAGRSRARL